jgi:hypothetical protein
MSDVNLPAVIKSSQSILKALTDALGVPRDILASDEEINGAWTTLPRVLNKVPPALRSEALVRMCVAVASGLFDSAINYVWNATVLELRDKVRRFGLNVVGQVIDKTDFDEKALLDLKDSELLELCLSLNLITEDGYFFLDQCRDIRNNFSAAHPAVGKIDDHELISFLNRCSKYALTGEQNPVGVDIQAFIQAIKGKKFTKDQRDEWLQRLRKTHEAQRELLISTLHGMFCDPAIAQEGRINALAVVTELVPELTPKAKSDLIDRHQDYLAKGDKDRHKASQVFFERLGLLNLLGDSERHALISGACRRLFEVHQAFDNFYNEPPFAERLLQVSSQGAIPDSAKSELVTTVVTCAVGNQYGVSRAAVPYYEQIIVSFTPQEVSMMMDLPDTKTVVGMRIKSYARCKDAFRRLVKLIDPVSVPSKAKKSFDTWKK